MTIPDFSVLTWIILTSLLGGVLSVAGAALGGAQRAHFWRANANQLCDWRDAGRGFSRDFAEGDGSCKLVHKQMTSTVLFGILLFFTLEKLVIWRHCHGDHCEVHAIHTEEDCPDNH